MYRIFRGQQTRHVPFDRVRNTANLLSLPLSSRTSFVPATFAPFARASIILVTRVLTLLSLSLLSRFLLGFRRLSFSIFYIQ